MRRLVQTEGGEVWLNLMLIVPRAFMYYTAQLTFWITFCNLQRATIDYNYALHILDNTLQCAPHIVQLCALKRALSLLNGEGGFSPFV